MIEFIRFKIKVDVQVTKELKWSAVEGWNRENHQAQSLAAGNCATSS